MLRILLELGPKLQGDKFLFWFLGTLSWNPETRYLSCCLLCGVFLGVINVASWKGCFTPALRQSPLSSKKNKLTSEKIKNHCQSFNPFFSIFFFLTVVPCIVRSSGIHCSFLEQHQVTWICTFECFLNVLSHPYLYVIINYPQINHLQYCPKLSLSPPQFSSHRKARWIALLKYHLVIKYFTKKIFSELWTTKSNLHLFSWLCKWIIPFTFFEV